MIGRLCIPFRRFTKFAKKRKLKFRKLLYIKLIKYSYISFGSFCIRNGFGKFGDRSINTNLARLSIPDLCSCWFPVHSDIEENLIANRLMRAWSALNKKLADSSVGACIRIFKKGVGWISYDPMLCISTSQI